jgi:Zn-dependent oligopeptidase
LFIQQCKKYGYPFNGQLDFWDMRYYTNLIEETKYSVDKELLKEYFPARAQCYKTFTSVIYIFL